MYKIKLTNHFAPGLTDLLIPYGVIHNSRDELFKALYSPMVLQQIASCLEQYHNIFYPAAHAKIVEENLERKFSLAGKSFGTLDIATKEEIANEKLLEIKKYLQNNIGISDMYLQDCLIAALLPNTKLTVLADTKLKGSIINFESNVIYFAQSLFVNHFKIGGITHQRNFHIGFDYQANTRSVKIFANGELDIQQGNKICTCGIHACLTLYEAQKLSPEIAYYLNVPYDLKIPVNAPNGEKRSLVECIRQRLQVDLTKIDDLEEQRFVFLNNMLHEDPNDPDCSVPKNHAEYLKYRGSYALRWLMNSESKSLMRNILADDQVALSVRDVICENIYNTNNLKVITNMIIALGELNNFRPNLFSLSHAVSRCHLSRQDMAGSRNAEIKRIVAVNFNDFNENENQVDQLMTDACRGTCINDIKISAAFPDKNTCRQFIAKAFPQINPLVIYSRYQQSYLNVFSMCLFHYKPSSLSTRIVNSSNHGHFYSIGSQIFFSARTWLIIFAEVIPEKEISTASDSVFIDKVGDEYWTIIPGICDAKYAISSVGNYELSEIYVSNSLLRWIVLGYDISVLNEKMLEFAILEEQLYFLFDNYRFANSVKAIGKQVLMKILEETEKALANISQSIPKLTALKAAVLTNNSVVLEAMLLGHNFEHLENKEKFIVAFKELNDLLLTVKNNQFKIPDSSILYDIGDSARVHAERYRKLVNGDEKDEKEDWIKLTEKLQLVIKITKYFIENQELPDLYKYFDLANTSLNDRKSLLLFLDQYKFTDPDKQTKLEKLRNIIKYYPDKNGVRLVMLDAKERHNAVIASITSEEPSQYCITFAQGALRPLHRNVSDIIMRNERVKDRGRHLMYRVAGNNYVTWLKFRPEQPLNAFAVVLFDWLFFGGGTNMSTTVRYQHDMDPVAAVEISEEAPGKSLTKVFKESPHELRSLEMSDFTRALFRVLVINPEDDKDNDYFLFPVQHLDGTVTYRLMRIDSDRAFFDIDELVKGKFRDKKTLIVKSIIPCLDQMQKKLDMQVIYEMANLDLLATLNEWLEILCQTHDEYANLFSKSEFLAHFRNVTAPGMSFLSIAIPETKFDDLICRLVDLQLICKGIVENRRPITGIEMLPMPQLCLPDGSSPTIVENRQTITGIEMLQILQPRLADYYCPLFESFKPNENPSLGLERFCAITNGLYDTGYFGRTNVEALSKSLALQPITDEMALRIRAGECASPVQASAKLQQLQSHNFEIILNGILDEVLSGNFVRFDNSTNRIKKAVLKIYQQRLRKSPDTDGSEISAVEQKENILRALSRIPHRKLNNLKIYAEVLTDELLEQLLQRSKDHLIALNLSNCSLLTVKSLYNIAKLCPSLQKLCLGGQGQIVEFDSRSLFFADYIFPELTDLSINKLSNIIAFSIISPKLKYLVIKECQLLSKIVIATNDKYPVRTELTSLILNDCPVLEEVDVEFTAQNLKGMNATGTSHITKGNSLVVTLTNEEARSLAFEQASNAEDLAAMKLPLSYGMPSMYPAVALHALSVAAKHGDLEILELVLNIWKSSAQGSMDGVNIALQMAIKNLQFEAIQLLLQKNSFAGGGNHDIHTMLPLLASHSGKATIPKTRMEVFDTFQLLIDRGATAQDTDNHGNTPLLLAASTGCLFLVQWLLENNYSSLIEKNHDGATAFLLAIKNKQLLCVEYLLTWSQKTVLFDRDNDGNTALHLAVQIGHYECVTTLVDRGFAIELKNSQGQEAICLAGSDESHCRIVQFLLAEYERKKSNQQSKSRSKILAISHLPERRVEDNVNNNDIFSEFFVATIRGQLQQMQALIAQYRKNQNFLHAKDKFGNTALLLASQNNRLEVVEWLLKIGANLETINDNGDSVVMLAAARNNLQMVKFFMETCNHSEINLRNKFGLTALDQAYIYVGVNSEVTEYLKSRGGASQLNIDRESYPLHYYTIINDPERLKSLLPAYDSIKTPDMKDEHGNTPLHIAAMLDCSNVVELIINSKLGKFLFKEQNAYGNIPLDLAIICNASITTIKLLLKYNSVFDEDSEHKYDKHRPLNLALNFGRPLHLLETLLHEGSPYYYGDNAAYHERMAAIVIPDFGTAFTYSMFSKNISIINAVFVQILESVKFDDSSQENKFLQLPYVNKSWARFFKFHPEANAKITEVRIMHHSRRLRERSLASVQQNQSFQEQSTEQRVTYIPAITMFTS